MANLSQLRRQRMLAFLEKMREQHKDDDEVLVAINEVENEINEKKYGLVWEEHSEEVEERMVDEVPIFVEDKDKEITMTDNGYNFLLEGDNLHSLHLVEKTHREKIDVIYIDPPYNTGKEFTYNDNLVVDADSFRHSKWLSFMERRLSIAKKLLKEDGVIFLSIDDNEQSQLKLLCDSVFGESNFIADFCIIRAEGGGMAKQVIKGHDYALAYAKDIDKFRPLARQKDVRGKVIEKDGVEYWIQEDWLRKEFGKYGNCHYEELVECKGEDYKKEIDEGLERGDYVLIEKSNGLHVIGKLRRLDEDSSKFYSIIKCLNKDGVNELKGFSLEATFDYPKPVQLIKDLVSGATFFKKKNAPIVLDFFAGSGTTGQAVLELNKEDGGNRHFILCTNNENGICDGVTYPRLQTVITGLRSDGSKYSDGIPADLKYYHTDFILKKSENLAADLIAHIDEMIQLEYGVKIDKEKYISILTDEDADEYYNCYICPGAHILTYSTTNRSGYKEYKSCGEHCAECQYLSKCTESKDHIKLITRHVWEEYMEVAEDIRHTIGNRQIYQLRKETIERIFGTAKKQHGFRYTQYVGKARMEMKAGLTFACMNLKKLAKILEKRGWNTAGFLLILKKIKRKEVLKEKWCWA